MDREQIEVLLTDIDQVASRVNKPPFRRMMQSIRQNVVTIRELIAVPDKRGAAKKSKPQQFKMDLGDRPDVSESQD